MSVGAHTRGKGEKGQEGSTLGCDSMPSQQFFMLYAPWRGGGRVGVGPPNSFFLFPSECVDMKKKQRAAMIYYALV